MIPYFSVFIVGLFLCVIDTRLNAEETSVSRMRPMLGTYVEITVHGMDRKHANHSIEEAFKAIDEMDRLLSSHRADSELNAINAAAGDRSVAVSPWTYECIAAAVEIGRQSKGAFDITCRPALDLWGFVRKEYRLPTRGELQRVQPLVNYQYVNLFINQLTTHPIMDATMGKSLSRVGLLKKGMQLDVGGIGKGFAVDKAIEALQEAGVRSGLVRIGGDLRGFGLEKWKIGIADPSNPQQTKTTFEIQNEAVSTSGDYENFFEVNNQRFSHIIDPKTGWPVHYHHSLSVRAPTCTLSDGWSTALFVNPDIQPPPSIRIVDKK